MSTEAQEAFIAKHVEALELLDHISDQLHHYIDTVEPDEVHYGHDPRPMGRAVARSPSAGPDRPSSGGVVSARPSVAAAVAAPFVLVVL